MSRKIRIIGMLAIFGALAVSAVGSATASAAFKLEPALCTGGKLTNMCWNNEGKLQELAGEEGLAVVLNAPQTLLFLFELGKEHLEISCEAIDITATALQKPLVEDGTIDLKAVFLGCILLTLSAKCEVPKERTSEELKGEWLLEELGHLEIINKEGEAKPIIVIPITSKAGQTCPATIVGNHSVVGFQLATLLKPELHMKTHELELHLESGLKVGENEAQLHCVKGGVEGNCFFSITPENLGDEWDLSKED